jgi:hypothetical protein
VLATLLLSFTTARCRFDSNHIQNHPSGVGIPYAKNTRVTSPTHPTPSDGPLGKPLWGSISGDPLNRQVTIQSKDGTDAALTTGGALYTIELFTNNPSCDTKAVTAQCQVCF